MKRVFIGRFNEEAELFARMKEGMDWIDAHLIIPCDARVFVKPNLTWTRPMNGVTTTPSVLEALIRYIRLHTSDITIVESNGGQNCFFAEESFEHHCVYEIAAKHGAKVINLSNSKTEFAKTTVGTKEIVVELPSILLHDAYVFITLPVPKVHAMTTVSMAFKNQWGCQPNPMRLRNHPRFAETVVAINKILKPQIAVFDGTYFLDYTGPMIGEPVNLNLLVISNDIGVGSLTCCEIMQINHERVKQFKIAKREDMFPEVSEVQFNLSPAQFSTRKFYVRRTLLNWIQLLAFNSRWANRLFYDSGLADPLHNVIYFIRRNSLVRKLLYGKFGPGEAIRRSSY